VPDAEEPMGGKPIGRIRLRLRRAIGAAWLAALLLVALPAVAKLAIVATTPDLESLATAIGGELVTVAAIVPPGADAEAFEPKPGDLAKLSGADLVVRVGLGYDEWLDRALARIRRTELMRGGAAQIDASTGIPLLEVQGRNPSDTGGHAHGLANPHYWLDPQNAVIITAAIAEGIIRLAPAQGDAIVANRDRFLARLEAKLAAWTARLAPFEGGRVVAYHNSWPYLARRFRLNVLAIIEPKEGVAPSPSRLAEIAGLMQNRKVRAILQETYEPDDAARLLAAKSGARIVRLATGVGAVPEAPDYLALFDYDVELLAHALGGDGG
jgi:ABC-type Zn uptake system ZnuABC Zn-binding protein ZnuA